MKTREGARPPTGRHWRRASPGSSGLRHRSNLDDLVTNGVADQVAHRVQIQLFHDAGAVRLHCFYAEVQGSGDFFVGFPLGHQLQDLALSRAELASVRDAAPVSYTHLTLPTKRIV